MKLNLLSITALTSSLLLSYAHAHAATLLFEINGVKNDSGNIYVSLFKGEENYQNGQANMAQIVQAQSGKKQVVFEGLEQGEYAIRYFHDENDNRQLERNLFGSPTEGYGFSNDAKPSYGPAKYAEMKFTVANNTDTVVNKSQVIYAK